MSQILEAIKNHPASNAALISGSRTLSYGDMVMRINHYMNSLQGVESLAVHLDNGIEWILWDLAALQSSTPCVPIPDFFHADQVSHIMATAGVSHMVDSDGIRQINKQDKEQQPVRNLPPGTAKITFTSGTTGTPKGVCLSRTGIETLAFSIQKSLDNKFATRHAVILPLAILLGNIAGVYPTLIAGGTIFIPPLSEIGLRNPFTPDLKQLTSYLRAQKITSVITVPELLRGLFSIRAALPDMKFMAVGGAKVAPELIAAAREAGLPVYEGYGLSEAASVVALNTPLYDKPGSVGKVLEHIIIKIENGEICIKNDAFLGYLGQTSGDWFRTGDLGFIDNDGYLHISGRKKNIIVTSHGRNVSPEWVESTLLAQPGIAQAIVYGDGESTIRALVVPSHPNADIQQSILNANLSLPEYAQIKAYQLTQPFSATQGTLTANGRPKREHIIKKQLTLESI
ncbi:AMP-binding protein [Pseudohongiella nitratireducens]|uniref:AMP-binding protein n=1 Tax=Pseudohongiella nitratireducens TaxID=1768907 RepID=UPI0030EC93AE|tara:strand:- start:8263 stop:9630 length:1368 start_codon:yes stop_codon:yes gene_type:complete